MTTSIDGQRAYDNVIVADGTARPFQELGCEGTKQVEWSRTSARLFTRGELICPGDKPHTVLHLGMLYAGTWLDILSVTRDGREGVRVRRYRREAEEPVVPPPANGCCRIYGR